MGAAADQVTSSHRDRATNQVRAKVVAIPDGPTLKGFVHENTEPDATVYTDESAAYTGLRRAL